MFERGDIVKFLHQEAYDNRTKDEQGLGKYPLVGTLGTVLADLSDIALGRYGVLWQSNTTTGDGYWAVMDTQIEKFVY